MMPRQTLFTYLPEEDRADQIFSLAATLARRHESHLIGSYVIPPLGISPMVGGEAMIPQAVYDGHAQIYRERSDALEQRFEALTHDDSFVSEWRTVDARMGSISEALMDHVRCADLVIAPHYNGSADDHVFTAVPETLAMESGRPVLMVPETFKSDKIGEYVTVAWDGSREAVRAVFDTLDMLKDAQIVRIVSVGEPPRKESSAAITSAEIAATLTRRGITCEADHVIPGDKSIGEALVGRVQDMGSDLLVMGIYGHSKLREFVFGGATRHVLNHMPVPVIFSR